MEYLSIRSEVDPKLRTTLSNERRSHLGANYKAGADTTRQRELLR